MTLLLIEGFDHFSSAPLTELALHAGWTTSSSSSSKVAGFFAGSGLSIGNVSFTYDTGANNTTLIIGYKVRFADASPATAHTFIQFRDSAAAVQSGLALGTDGKIYAWRGTNGTSIATGTQVLLDATWYNIELKFNFSNTGSVSWKIDGTVDGTAASVDTTQTANQNAKTIQFLGSTLSSQMAVDDLYICDDVGSAPHNDFLGNCRVETLYPTSANATQWTPLSSTNVSNVDDTATDGDTTYNSTSTSGHVDTFNHGSLASTPVTIFGVAVHTEIRKDDVTARTARNKLISGATTTNGASNTLSTSYAWMVDQYIVDPNTAAAWTGANVNATKIGYEHI